MDQSTIFGMSQKTAIMLLMIAVLILLGLLIFTIHQMNIISRKYRTLMSGKRGADLEKVIRVRFKEMDNVKANAKRVTKEHKDIKKHLSSCFSKYGIVKYDAFDEMAGKLSFALALLNEDNTGIILNAMHSREGCFTYAKEIIKGESYIPLSDEEKDALERAKTVEEEIEDLTSEGDSDIDFDFDL